MHSSIEICHTVLCQTHSGIDACDAWSDVAVVVRGAKNAQEAASNACLYLINEQGGKARATRVIDGNPKIVVPKSVVFDAQEGDDMAMLNGDVVACTTLDDPQV